MARAGAPAWQGMTGARRIQAEFKHVKQQIDAGQLPQIFGIFMVSDDLYKWRFKLKNFDNDCQPGRDLNADLAQLFRKKGQNHLVMEIQFPQSYPSDPFFLRVISPRCVWYTGHVTAGGSVCIEALTQSGSMGSWSSQYNVESMLMVVLNNMLHCESYYVKTASGPGGQSGPLRIDLNGAYHHDVMAEYTEAEARSAFSRMQSHHKANGWR
ncbi:hypothetical protein WJX74_009995 [Apatococcus lobatus]|uniref:UBC core domain-containing protein n=1 Tax=Apatococcus lobatus TaxID=904363 RepID=A0AAW1RFB8_9CHLO